MLRGLDTKFVPTMLHRVFHGTGSKGITNGLSTPQLASLPKIRIRKRRIVAVLMIVMAAADRDPTAHARQLGHASDIQARWHKAQCLLIPVKG